MPMHDWTRVIAGIYHHMHSEWITSLSNALNDGLLPESFYALGEQRAGLYGPDVVAMQTNTDDYRIEPDSQQQISEPGVQTLSAAPPRVSITQTVDDENRYAFTRQRHVAIRHASDDRLVALIEIVSPGNKRSERSIDDFVDKVLAAIDEGIHVLALDPLPPGLHDLQGIHGEIWNQAGFGARFEFPDERRLTLVSYASGETATAYVEPFAVGSVLIDMPLFLTRDHYINVPLESTYQKAWAGVPQRWRQVIEPGSTASG